MSSWILHQDEDYFPNAKEFNPDRWSNLKEAWRMDKCFIPFEKGSRACVGMPYVNFLFSFFLFFPFPPEILGLIIIQVLHIANSTLPLARFSDGSNI